MFQVCFGCYLESFGCGFGKIVSATTVAVHADIARHDVHAFGINHFGTDDSQVAVGHFQNLSVADEYGTVFQPPLRGEDFSIDYLC